jgi:two-component system nitrogen regulation sensor histidine kinase GlnL
VTTPFPGLELLATAVLLLDERLQVTYANPAAETLLAHGRKHLLGAPIAKVLPGNDRFIARLAQAVADDTGFNENELALELAGQPVTVHCVAVPVEEGDARLLIELRELDQQLRIAKEAKLLEQQQANRELIRNLAHEIKNPLGGIRGAAQLLERELPDPGLREFTQVIVKETDRLQSLMNRMLTPHRLPQIEMLNVHEVMERVRTLVLAEHPEGLAVRRDYDVSLPDLPGDKESLIQAVLNVARNAAQAMGGRGRSAADLLLRVAYGMTPIGRMVRKAVSTRLPRLVPEGRLSSVLRKDVEEQFADRREGAHAAQAGRMRDLPRRLYHDVFHASLPALLRYEDRNSMAHSIEARTPFLDYRLVELAFNMPMTHKIHEGWTKRALRDATQGVLPPEIQWRKDKKGFVTPEAIWLRQGREHLREAFAGTLACDAYLDAAALRKELDRSLDANPDGVFYTDVFRWFLLEKWMRSTFGAA